MRDVAHEVVKRLFVCRREMKLSARWRLNERTADYLYLRYTPTRVDNFERDLLKRALKVN